MFHLGLIKDKWLIDTTSIIFGLFWARQVLALFQPYFPCSLRFIKKVHHWARGLIISEVFFPRFLDNCSELFLITEKINTIKCVVLIPTMTFDELPCLPKEHIKRLFQSEIVKWSTVTKEEFVIMYLSNTWISFSSFIKINVWMLSLRSGYKPGKGKSIDLNTWHLFEGPHSLTEHKYLTCWT